MKIFTLPFKIFREKIVDRQIKVYEMKRERIAGHFFGIFQVVRVLVS